MVKFTLSSKKPPTVGKEVPLQRVRIRGPRIVKRPNPGTFVNKKGILPSSMIAKKTKLRTVRL